MFKLFLDASRDRKAATDGFHASHGQQLLHLHQVQQQHNAPSVQHLESLNPQTLPIASLEILKKILRPTI